MSRPRTHCHLRTAATLMPAVKRRAGEIGLHVSVEDPTTERRGPCFRQVGAASARAGSRFVIREGAFQDPDVVGAELVCV